MKNSFDIFFQTRCKHSILKQSTKWIYEIHCKTKGLQKLLLNGLQPLRSESAAMAATPMWLGHIIEDIFTYCIIPNIPPPSKFHTEELHRAFQQQQSKQFSAFSTCLHLD